MRNSLYLLYVTLYHVRRTLIYFLYQGTIMLVFFVVLFFLIVVLGLNYYEGKSFKLNQNSDSNDIFLIVVPLPEQTLITNLETTIREKGSVLNLDLNFNNAKGKKLNYTQLSEKVKKFYENESLRRKVSNVLGEDVFLAGLSEKYRIFARLYENEEDFLDWHYDNNFTMGKRYTLVIPLILDVGNTSEFRIKDPHSGEEKMIPIPLGKGVLYNGSVTYHSITKQTRGNRRMVVIIPFYTNYKKSLLGHVREFMRNVVYRNLSL